MAVIVGKVVASRLVSHSISINYSQCRKRKNKWEQLAFAFMSRLGQSNQYITTT
jgi:hypothetical protein